MLTRSEAKASHADLQDDAATPRPAPGSSRFRVTESPTASGFDDLSMAPEAQRLAPRSSAMTVSVCSSSRARPHLLGRSDLQTMRAAAANWLAVPPIVGELRTLTRSRSPCGSRRSVLPASQLPPRGMGLAFVADLCIAADRRFTRPCQGRTFFADRSRRFGMVRSSAPRRALQSLRRTVPRQDHRWGLISRIATAADTEAEHENWPEQLAPIRAAITAPVAGLSAAVDAQQQLAADEVVDTMRTEVSVAEVRRRFEVNNVEH